MNWVMVMTHEGMGGSVCRTGWRVKITVNGFSGEGGGSKR